MRVCNKTDHPVFVDGHGDVQGGEEATLRESDQVKQLIKDGAFEKVSASSSNTENKEGDG